MEEKEIQDELTSIRSLMERSSKFISLSGLSGILAGIYALIGAAAAFNILYTDAFTRNFTIGDDADAGKITSRSYLLLSIALLVLIASVITGFILSYRKAKQKRQPLWGQTSRSLLFHMATPLVTGGIFILILIIQGHYGIVASASLIFYGLSLVSASNFTYTLIKYLGLSEIILGLIAACLPGYGLLFWAIGFGVLHIIYGSMMYLKYDR
ncbi:hypothetical protein [Mucilaginibacter sp.]|uniref:hypothetical protein n=1 Tax=Mucilaginibacter sp. TaxID=1882438 RepID=UPI003D145DF6